MNAGPAIATPSVRQPILTQEQLTTYCQRIPFNVHLGIEVLSVSAIGVQLQLPWQALFSGSAARGHMHGGVIATLVDVACGMTMVAFTGRGAPTVDMRVDFHRGVTPGDLRAEGRALRLGKSLAVVDASIFDSTGQLVASGRAVFSTAHQDAVPVA